VPRSPSVLVTVWKRHPPPLPEPVRYRTVTFTPANLEESLTF
jgi:hypothetical protein